MVQPDSTLNGLDERISLLRLWCAGVLILYVEINIRMCFVYIKSWSKVHLLWCANDDDVHWCILRKSRRNDIVTKHKLVLGAMYVLGALYHLCMETNVYICTNDETWYMAVETWWLHSFQDNLLFVCYSSHWVVWEPKMYVLHTVLVEHIARSQQCIYTSWMGHLCCLVFANCKFISLIDLGFEKKKRRNIINTFIK